MATTKNGVILYNQYNRQITPVDKVSMGLFPSQYAYPNYGNFRPRFYTLQDTESALDVTSRQNLVKISRELFAQMPSLAVAAEQKAEWAIGDCFDLIYKGNNSKWWSQVEPWVQNWYNVCNTKGFAYDFKTTLKIVSQLLDIDGDVLMLFINSRSGLPLLQFMPNHRVGQRVSDAKEITEGRYKGYKVNDGVVYSSSGYPVAYCVIGETVDDDQILSNRDAQLVFNPKFMDKGRGIPAIASAVLTGLSIQEIDTYLQEIIKLESCVGLVETNQAGEAPQEYADILSALRTQQGSQSALAPTPSIHGVEVIQGPSVRYIKAEGGKLESFASNRPSVETTEFVRKLEVQLLSAVGFPHQVLYSPEKVGGAAARSIGEIVRKSIHARQVTLKKYARLAVIKSIGTAMANGIIPENYDEKLDQVFDFSLPAQFTLDSGYERQADLADYKIGIKTANDITSKYGKRFVDVRNERKQETLDLLSDVEEVAKLHPDVSKNRILDLLSMRGSNSLPEPSNNTQETSTPSDKEEA